jgi:uncharacterized protein YbjT (DUF2867 family)
VRPVLVIGATGGIGRAVVDHLADASVPVRALTRRADASVFPDGVAVVEGDLTNPSSLDAALHGAGAVFLLWTAPPDTVSEVIARIASHAQRVVFLSSPHNVAHPFFQQTPDNAMARLHVAIEREIANAGIASTILRPGMFASNALHWWAPSIRNREPIEWPYVRAETAPIDERDVAAVAAAVLCDVGHAGREYVLTGPESMSQSEQVRIIGDVVGRRIQLDELSPDEFRGKATAWPAPVLDMLLAAWKGTLGVPALVTSTVGDVTGTPARPFRAWVADHVSAFM